MSNAGVIVTGGFGALGTAMAKAFRARGRPVVRIDFLPAPPNTADTFDLGGVDLTNPEHASTAMASARAAIGPVAALVNVAGGFTFSHLSEGGPAPWRDMFEINLLSCVTATDAALPLLLRSPGAGIVNIGAAAAAQGGPGMGAYTAAKSGVARFTESLAQELALKDITINAILPSIIDTAANRRAMPATDPGAWVTPEAVAEIAAFLLSSAARSISGVLLPVTRGQRFEQGR